MRINRKVLVPTFSLDSTMFSMGFSYRKYPHSYFILSYFSADWSERKFGAWSSWEWSGFIPSTWLWRARSMWWVLTVIYCWIAQNVFKIFLIMNFHYIWEAWYFFFRNSKKNKSSLKMIIWLICISKWNDLMALVTIIPILLVYLWCSWGKLSNNTEKIEQKSRFYEYHWEEVPKWGDRL